jgi:hypothetical protein
MTKYRLPAAQPLEPPPILDRLTGTESGYAGGQRRGGGAAVGVTALACATPP